MEKINIGFLGYGTRALDALMEHPLFSVRHFITPEDRLCQDVYDAEKKYKKELDLVIVKNNNELFEEIKKCQDVECFLINACSIILKENVLHAMPFYNIHPGDLSYNRGHQPHMWTVLLGEKKSKISLHTVTPGIDEGLVIASKELRIASEWDAQVVLDKLEDEIPWLLDSLYNYLRKGAQPEGEIYGGGYRKIMDYEDYRIDFERAGEPSFVLETERKIRARIVKHGAFFYWNQKRVYVDRLLEVTKEDGITDVSYDFGSFSDPECVRVRAAGKQFVFHIRTIVSDEKRG